MDEDKIIYSLCVQDILTVIEDKVGNIIHWRGAIEFALYE